MTDSGQKKILIICYSFSGQTNGLLRRLQSALEAQGHLVTRERLATDPPLRFPVGNFPSTIKMMLTTFVRCRVPIQEISPACKEKHDLIILAGPTWSYNPSGPILSLIDRDGPQLFAGQTVLPLISCRGYWRCHWWGLKQLLSKCGAKLPNNMVFSHPNPEPWRTIGVFLKIAGRTPERVPWLSKHYSRFGHSRSQQDEAERFGTILGQALSKGTSLEELDFRNPLALP